MVIRGWMFFLFFNNSFNIIPATPREAFNVDFDKSMGFKMKYTRAEDKTRFEFLRNLYKQSIGSEKSEKLPARTIPKIIHQIWLGGEIPQKFIPLMESWKKLHPDWEYIIWTDKEASNFQLFNRKLFDKSKNYGQKADILRYEILFHYGGLYIDVDFLCLKPFDVLHENYDFYTGLGVDTVDLLNGLIAAVPGHPILKHAIESMSGNCFNDILSSTGPYHFTKSFFSIAPFYQFPIIVLPTSYFYPAPAIARGMPYSEQNKYVKPESFAIHYWACSWQH